MSSIVFEIQLCFRAKVVSAQIEGLLQKISYPKCMYCLYRTFSSHIQLTRHRLTASSVSAIGAGSLLRLQESSKKTDGVDK
jgi:hypothetical protein